MSEVLHLEWEFLAKKVENLNARLARVKAEREQPPMPPKIRDEDMEWLRPSDCEVPFQ